MDQVEQKVVASEDEEKILLKKVRRRIIPIVFAMYCVSVMDRANLANANVDLAKKLNLKGTQTFIVKNRK